MIPSKKILAPLALALALLGFLGDSAPAQAIFSSGATGNPLNLGDNTGGLGNIEGREVGFTMKTTSYTLTSIVLPLAFSSTLSSSNFTLTLYGYATATGSAFSTTPDSTTVFTSPTFTYNNAGTTSSTVTLASYTFIPTTALTLNAGWTYWLVAGDTDTTSGTVTPVYWNGGSGTFSTSAAAETSPGAYYSRSGNSTRDVFVSTASSGLTPAFTMNGVAVVPEPSTWVLAMLGLALLALQRRSQRKPEAAVR